MAYRTNIRILTAVVAGGLVAAMPVLDASAVVPDAPACGTTVTTDTTLTADLTCAGDGLTLRPGVTLDLAGHALRAGGTALAVSATDGRRSSTEVRGGSVAGAITLTGTPDADDQGRVQRLRLVRLEVPNGSLSVAHGLARLAAVTATGLAIRQDASTLNVVRSTLTDVAKASDASPANVWNLTGSTVTGQWWRTTGAGDRARVVDSTVTDPTPAPNGGPRPTYGDVTVLRSTLEGPEVGLFGVHEIRDSELTDVGPSGAYETIAVTGSTLRRVQGISTSEAIDVADSTVQGGTGFSALWGVTATGNVFRNVLAPIEASETLTATRNRFVGNRGPATVRSTFSTFATGNVLIGNAGIGFDSRGGRFEGNVIREQGGSGITYHDNRFDDTDPISLGSNRVIDGAGWGIDATQDAGDDKIADLGGNIARGNTLGQCRGVTCTPR